MQKKKKLNLLIKNFYFLKIIKLFIKSVILKINKKKKFVCILIHLIVNSKNSICKGSDLCITILQSK